MHILEARIREAEIRRDKWYEETRDAEEERATHCFARTHALQYYCNSKQIKKRLDGDFKSLPGCMFQTKECVLVRKECGREEGSSSGTTQVQTSKWERAKASH